MTLTIRGRHLSLIVKTYMRGQYVLAARTEQGLVTTLRQHLRRDVEIPDVKACTLDFCGAPADIQAQLREIAAAEQRRELIMRFSVSVVESGVPAGLQRCLDDEDPYHFTCQTCRGLGVVGLDVEDFLASATVQRELAVADVPQDVGNPTHVFLPCLGHHEPGLEVWTIGDYREVLDQGAENKPLAFARLEYVEVPEAVVAAIREYEEAVAAEAARKEAKRAAAALQRDSAEEVKRLETRAWTARLVGDYLAAIRHPRVQR